jgi:hypothetical protein
MTKSSIIIESRTGLICLVGALLVSCLSLPSEQTVARMYEREHPSAKILSVTKTTENKADPLKAHVRFYISFTNPPDPTIRHDLWTYGRVAEGWLRGANN